jgi:hypothetical protein
MRQTFLVLFGLFLTLPLFAQQKAVTENGEEVLLYADGTWQYASEKIDSAALQIAVNPYQFVKGDKSTFLLKSNKVPVGIWLDPKKWNFKKSTNNEFAEYDISSKNGDLYGMLIPEKIEIPLERLREVALGNGKKVSSDLRVVQEEYRTVNGLKVLMIQMDGTVSGIKLSYFGYYFSSEKGTVQLIMYTSQNLFNDYKKACEEFLNGFVVTE